MNELFILIEEKSDGPCSQILFVTTDSQKQVIGEIAAVSSAGIFSDKSDTIVKRILKIDEYGNVKEYDAVFEKGRFTLKEKVGTR